MSLVAFQIACLLVLAAAYALDLRCSPWPRRRLATIALLAVAAALGEHSVIAAYGYYHYAPGWWLRMGNVPLLVPLIWPLVILSARAVVERIWPGGGLVRRALRVAAVVVFDASLIEVCAVAAGLWRWEEGGYLGVPLMGLAGWGCFAFAASLWLDAPPRAWLRLSAPILLVAASHALILALWWGLFRWGPRADLGTPAIALYALAAAAYALAVAAARRTRPALPVEVTLARALATSVFVALLLAVPGASWPPWVHFGLTALPYLAASLPGAAARRPTAASAEKDVPWQAGP